MNLFCGLILIGCVALLSLLPFAITVLIFFDPRCFNWRGSQKWILVSTILSGIFHFVLFLFLHKKLTGRYRLLQTIKDIGRFRFSYQEIGDFILSFGCCLIFSVLLGLLIKFLLSAYRPEVFSFPAGPGRKGLLFLCIAISGLALTLCFSIRSAGLRHIVINEVCSNNQSAFYDEDGTTPDYIELYHSGLLPCDLEGLYLSDDAANLKKQEIPSQRILSKDFLLIPLDRAFFSLKSSGGETIWLSDSDGHILDHISLEAMEADFSYARRVDGKGPWKELGCTPAQSNESAAGRIAEPVFSHTGGFYPEPFDLTITSPTEDPVYYTLDGSLPTEDSMLYEGPIRVYDRNAEPNTFRSTQNVVDDWLSYEPDRTPVDKAFVIRAAAISEDGDRSRPVTATYFIHLEEYEQNTVLSLVTDPEGLFGENGIYVTGEEYDQWYLGSREEDAPEPNYNKKGMEAEVETSLEYFRQGERLSQTAGLRIAGASARSELPIKYFSLFAREQYSGQRLFDIRFFDDISSHKVTLRQGHANAFCQALVRDRDVATERYARASVFLNGEFWYHTNILEKYDSQYFLERYGIPEDNLIVVKQCEIEEGRESDLALYWQLYDMVNGLDLSDPANFELFCQSIDLQSYIDYMCINIYIDNMDFSDAKNVVMWRSRDVTGRPFEDGRWRWALHDLDAMEWDDADFWSVDSKAAKNTFSLQPKYTVKVNEQPTYKALKANETFRRQFVLTFMDLVNTDFKYENVEPKLKAYQEGLVEKDGRFTDLSFYETFFSRRSSIIVPYMAEEFGLTGTLEPITIGTEDPQKGTVTINTVSPVPASGGKWTGFYYTDYPVMITAVPGEGYCFAGWEGTYQSEEASIVVPVQTGGIELYAIFKETEE